MRLRGHGREISTSRVPNRASPKTRWDDIERRCRADGVNPYGPAKTVGKRESRRALFTATRNDWKTPVDFMATLQSRYGPLTDVSDLSRGDAFSVPWPDRWYANPPYGPPMRRWVDRAVEQAALGSRGIMLVPARTDTRWFHAALPTLSAVGFIRGRLRFDERGPAPFPSLLLFWGDPGEP